MEGATGLGKSWIYKIKKNWEKTKYFLLTAITLAVIVIFAISNKNDEAFLVNPKNQDKISKAIVRGIKSYSSDAKQQLSN